MAWRQLPDGSWFDPNSGDLRGVDNSREAAARDIAIRNGTYRPRAPAQSVRPPMPQQQFVALPGTQGPQVIIDPKQRLLAVNPYELGLGADPAPAPAKMVLSDNMKRMLAIGGVLAAAFGVVYLEKRWGKK